MYEKESSTSHASSRTSHWQSLEKARSEDSRRGISRSDAPGLPDLAIDAAPAEDALIDPVEHGAHRGCWHPIEVAEDRPPWTRLDLEPTEIPLLGVDDGRPLGQGRQGHPSGELP